MNIDDIFSECTKNEQERNHKRLIGYNIIVTPWKQFEETKSVNYNDVIKLAESYDWHRKGFSMQIAENLYRYNSKANIVKVEDKSLIVLPESEVAIDLFNSEQEDFIGPQYKDDVDYYINEILKVIGREGYVFYSLNDALRANNILQRVSPFSKYCIEKDAVITNGISILKEYGWRFIMDKLLHGNHNWVCSTTYLHAILKMQSSLIRYNVICYECLPYIREDKEYCIETKWQLDNDVDTIDNLEENKQIAIFACYCPSDETKERWTGNTAVKFLGVYKLDKERSKIENHLAFKRYSDDKLYI
jgi:hypothetical protein